MKLLLVAYLSMALVTGRAVAEGGTLGKEALSDFQWFQSLGYPDVKEAPWVEAWTGSYMGSQPPKAITTPGFLLHAESGTFTLLRLDLRSATYKETNSGTEMIHRVGYEMRPFREMAEQFLEESKNQDKDQSEVFRRQFGIRLGWKAQTFFLAYACWRKGEEGLAVALYDAARTAPPWAGPGNEQKKEETLRESVARELAHAATWQAVLLFGGGDWGANGQLMSRKELLKVFRDLERKFPNNPHQERVRQTGALLVQMVAEDAKHPPLAKEDLAKLPVEDQAKEWVFRLRDQNGHQFSQPGWCDVFGDFGEGSGVTPAHELMRIGYPAVPFLIEALSDNRFSRSVGFHRNFHFSHHVLTVGDCAQQILTRIAKRSFYSPASTSSYMARDEEVARTRAEAEQWWREFQSKGEAQSLIDGIVEAGQHPAEQVRRLKEIRPEAVEGALLQGAASAKDAWLLSAYLEQLGAIKSELVRNFLRAHMADKKDRNIRVQAARQLWKQGDPTAIPAMIEEWKGVPGNGGQKPDDQFEPVIQLLIASGEVAAIEALAGDLDKRGVVQRFEVVEELGKVLSPGESRRDSPWGMDSRIPDPAAVEAGEALLVRALEDDESRVGMSGSIGAYNFMNPRVCDFALWSLHQIFPERYDFSSKAGLRQRDFERLTAANSWRAKHGKAYLPLPEANPPKLAPVEALRIVSVTIAPKPTESSSKLFTEIVALKNSDFGEKTLSTIFDRFVAREVPGVRGLRVEVSRENDLTGVSLRITPVMGVYSSQGYWKVYYSGMAGEGFVGNSSGTLSYESVMEESAWQDMTKAVKQILKLPPKTEFFFSAGLEAQ